LKAGSLSNSSPCSFEAPFVHRGHPPPLNTGDNESLREKLKSEWTVLEGENKKYVYGEVSLLALSDVLHRFCPHGGVFYDLGSGSGRAVFSAAINHPTFTKLVGVELLEGLHTIADRALGAYNEVRLVCLPSLVVSSRRRCSGRIEPLRAVDSLAYWLNSSCPTWRDPSVCFRWRASGIVMTY
jgi:hypothetical protein